MYASFQNVKISTLTVSYADHVAYQNTQAIGRRKSMGDNKKWYEKQERFK